VTSDNHVSPEALAAWAEGRLAAAEASTVETHLSICASCQETLAVFARTEAAVESGFSRITPRSAFGWFRWRWAIPVAAAATAAAIWVALPNNPSRDEFERTVAPAIEERAARAPTPPASADTAAPTPEASALSSRRDAANSGLEDRAQKQAPAAEQDQDLKRESPPAAAAEAVRAPEAPAASEQARLRAETFTGVQRQAAATEVNSPDPLVRWRIVVPGQLERSTDGAATWQAVRLPQPVALVAVQAPSATSAIVTTADGRQFRTDDQGKTWNPVQP
jgi:hypothetical protein